MVSDSPNWRVGMVHTDSFRFPFVSSLFGCGVSAWMDPEKGKKTGRFTIRSRYGGDCAFGDSILAFAGPIFVFFLSSLSQGSGGFNQTHLHDLHQGDTESVPLFYCLYFLHVLLGISYG